MPGKSNSLATSATLGFVFDKGRLPDDSPFNAGYTPLLNRLARYRSILARKIPRMPDWKALYPFESKFLEIPKSETSSDKVRMHYVEQGATNSPDMPTGGSA